MSGGGGGAGSVLHATDGGESIISTGRPVITDADAARLVRNEPDAFSPSGSSLARRPTNV